MAKKVKVSDLVKHFHLDIMCGEEGLKRLITVADLSRPGLEMAGFFNFYPKERIQILGKSELTFFETLSAEDRRSRMELLCNEETPCICIARGLPVPEELIAAGTQSQTPIIRSAVPTTTLASQITDFLESKLAPSTTIHGVLVDGRARRLWNW
jgi:HPr kinase/phosphorylase